MSLWSRQKATICIQFLFYTCDKVIPDEQRVDRRIMVVRRPISPAHMRMEISPRVFIIQPESQHTHTRIHTGSNAIQSQRVIHRIAAEWSNHISSIPGVQWWEADGDGGIRGNKQEEQEKSDEQPCHYGPTRHDSNEEAKHERPPSKKSTSVPILLDISLCTCMYHATCFS